MNRTGDITIGDFWGINKVNADFNDNKGISLVLCNTDKGKAFFECIKEEIDYIETDAEHCLQPALMRNSNKPKDREVFWWLYNRLGKVKFARIYQYKIKLGYKLKRK